MPTIQSGTISDPCTLYSARRSVIECRDEQETKSADNNHARRRHLLACAPHQERGCDTPRNITPLPTGVGGGDGLGIDEGCHFFGHARRDLRWLVLRAGRGHFPDGLTSYFLRRVNRYFRLSALGHSSSGHSRRDRRSSNLSLRIDTQSP